MATARALFLLVLSGLCSADNGNRKMAQSMVFNNYIDVTKTLASVEMSVENSKLMETLVQKGGRKSSKLDQRLVDLADLLGRVAAVERQIKEYVEVQDSLEWSTLNDFARWGVSHDPSALTGLLERIHHLVVPPYKFLLGHGLFELALDFLQVSGQQTIRAKLSQEMVAGF